MCLVLIKTSKFVIEEIKALVAEIDVPVPDKNLEIGDPKKQEGKDF